MKYVVSRQLWRVNLQRVALRCEDEDLTPIVVSIIPLDQVDAVLDAAEALGPAPVDCRQHHPPAR
eukprot:2307481-Prymnesium_polylepis.2